MLFDFPLFATFLSRLDTARNREHKSSPFSADRDPSEEHSIFQTRGRCSSHPEVVRPLIITCSVLQIEILDLSTRSKNVCYCDCVILFFYFLLLVLLLLLLGPTGKVRKSSVTLNDSRDFIYKEKLHRERGCYKHFDPSRIIPLIQDRFQGDIQDFAVDSA